MLDILIKGGPVMIPILLCGVVATIFVIERFIYYRGVSRETSRVERNLEAALEQGRLDEAETLSHSSEAPMARLAEAALKFRDMDEAAIREAVQNAAGREVPRLERYISVLGTIANISTLLGLLGTVTGNIRAFGVLAASGAMGNPALLAGAIAEALITTAAGLIISIPATIFYNYFLGVVNRTVVGLETWSGDLVLLIVRARGKSGANAPREAGRAL